MYSWCADLHRPVIFDIGAHTGFVATQLAQALRSQTPAIFCFEPIPSTFSKLQLSVERLQLEDLITPLPCALSDNCGLLHIRYDEWDSMLAQVVVNGIADRLERVIYSCALTIDDVAASTNLAPALVKIDVEGYEPHVFRGAAKVLSSEAAPGVLFELNPSRLRELGLSVDDLSKYLPHYSYYYVSSWRDRTCDRFGERINSLRDISSDCDIFAVPNTQQAQNRWERTVSALNQCLT